MSEEPQELYDINTPKFIYNKLIQISEVYLKYIIGYRSSTKDYIKSLKSIHKTYDEKMKSIKLECQKNKYFDLSKLFPILNSIPSINSSFLENLNFLITELETLINGLQNYMKEKKILYNKFFQSYNDSKKDLLIKMNDLEKEKNSFLNNMSITEKNISEFYKNKLKIEDYSKEHNNSNNNETIDLKNLFIMNNTLESQKEKSIKDSQNIEKNYKSLISNSKIFKKSFFFTSNNTIDNIKSISYEIIIELKDFLQNIIILLKNSYTIPLKEIDNDLSKLINKKDEYEKSFYNMFTNLREKINDQFPIEAQKYSLNVFNSDKNIKNFIFEDELNDEGDYLDNDLDYLIAKEMISSFTLINEKYKINFELEDEKRTTNKIMTNLLCNLEKKSKKKKTLKDAINEESNQNPNELKYVHENDIKLLYKLLDKHYNRAVFLQTISHFRTSGKFCIPPKIYDIIGKCLLIVIDTVTRDEDYNIVKTAIILSQTYFKLDENNNKIYLQNVIKNHKVLNNNQFWEKTLDISLKNEINRVKKIKKEDNEINENNIENNKNQKEDNIEKYNDIAFGQIVSLVNSMIDFEINIDEIKKIIEPKIEEYKLTEMHKNNIKLVIDNKINAGKGDSSIINNSIHNEENEDIKNEKEEGIKNEENEDIKNEKEEDKKNEENEDIKNEKEEDKKDNDIDIKDS